MKTNLLSNLSNGLKKGTGLTQVGYRQGTGKVQAGEKHACGRKESLAWSQVELISDEGAIEHPLSTHSAPFGIRWKPAGEKGSSRVWKYVAMIFAVLVMSVANIGMAWGAINNTTVTKAGGSQKYIDVKTTAASNGDEVTVAKQYIAYTINDLLSSAIKNVWYTQSSSGSGSSNTDAVSLTGYRSACNKYIGISSSKKYTHYVTNCVSFSALYDPRSSGRYCTITATNVDDAEDVLTITNSGSVSSGTKYNVELTGLAESKYYRIVVETNNGSDSRIYQIRLEAPTCDAGDPGNISIDSFDPATNKITLKAEGSAATGDTWYWQASASGTSTSEAYVSAGKEITAAGTYYLRSYNGECWSDAKSIEVTAADFVVKYAITKGTHVNGDFTISPTLQEAGEEVTLVASPSAGYLLDAWNIIKTADGSATGITVTNNKFTMPAYAVTVNATFVVDPCSAWGYGTANTTAPSSGNSVTVGDLTVANVGCSTSSTTPFSGGTSTGVILGNGASKYITGTLGGDEIASIRFSIYTTDAAKPTYVVAFSSSATYDAATVLKVSGDYTAYFYNDAPLATGTRKDVEVTAPAGAKSFAIGRNLSGVSHGGTEQNSGSRGVYYIAACPADEPSCTAPNHVDISGRWDRFGGETISLTATAYSSAGTGSPIADGNITGWQWEKLIGSTWTPLSNGTAAGVTTSGATTKNLQIANCGAGNSGKYRCIVSTGATCSTASATATDGSEGLGVKVYVLECYNGGTTEHHFTRTGDTQAGTLTMTLSANTAYTFKVHADNTYYGNSGTIDKDETNWVMCNSDNGASCGNLTVNSGLGGTFTFGIEYSTSGNSSVEGEPELSVTYPRKTMYLVPNSDWTSNSAKFAFYYYGNSGTGWTDFLTSNDCGMSAEIPQWNGLTVIAVRFNSSEASPGWNGDGHVWNQTGDITATADKNCVTITDWNAGTYGTYSIPTYTISYATGSTTATGGAAISGSKAAETKTCGVDFTLPSSAVFTATGYTQVGWTTTDGGAQTHALGGTYTTNATQTFYPVWEEAASLTALECNTRYTVHDMAAGGCGTLSGTSCYSAGLSANSRFEVLGDPSKTDQAGGTPEQKTNTAQTINSISFNSFMYLKGDGLNGSTEPTCRGVKFIIPSAGRLTIYYRYGDRSKLKKEGESAVNVGTTTDGYGYDTHDVTAGTYYIYGASGGAVLIAVEYQCCTTPAAPTAFSAGSITSTGATFSITDAADAASYDIYYSTSSDAPTAGTAATTTSDSKTKAVTGLTASTTYYAWVRSVCDADHKSAWVALGTTSFTTAAAEPAGDCEELFAGRATSTSVFTPSVGSATFNLSSGNSFSAGGYSYSVKPNSSNAIVASPKAGGSFAAGDSLIVVIYNNESGSKTMGFRLGSGTYSTSVGSKKLHIFRQVLVASDISAGKVTFNRQSSDDRWVEIIIKHCGLLPSCTTPVIPTLSNQTVCPGNDIAAWDATQTASLETGETATYSWKKKGSETVLGTSATLDLGSSATESQSGTYVVTVTVSADGKASKSASKEVTLTVTAAVEEPSITASKTKVYAEDEVTLTATCGSTGVTWNWYKCSNADGTGAGSSLATTAAYTISSAPAVGTHYYKAVATGDGTHSCGTAEYVYTLTVSAANACDTEFWFAKEADRPTGAAAATHITGCPSGSSSASYTASIDGTNYTITGCTGQKTGNVTITVPADNTGTLYVVVQGSSSRTITLSKGGTQIDQQTPTNSVWGVYTVSDLDAGTYTLVSSGNISWGIIALKLCPTISCSDATPTATATNTTVCAGGTITITATGYEDGATFQWQKQNASTNAWENITDSTRATLCYASATSDHAGNYQVVATKTCARTSNTVTIAVPGAPVFGAITSPRTVMETQALAINDVEASDATGYKWYKSANNTLDASDPEIGDSKNLIKAYDGEAIASPAYYVFCIATNSCGADTTSAIAINVTAYVEQDCATRGNEGEAEFEFDYGSAGQGSYSSTACWTMNSNSKFLTYTAPEGKYFKTAKVTIASSSESRASYNWSTDGGSTYTAVALTVNSTLTERTINLSAHGNVDKFQIGRNFNSTGSSNGTLYVSKICFEYIDACTATRIDVSDATRSYNMSGDFTEPTFTLKNNSTGDILAGTLTYHSSNEDIAEVDDEGDLSFNGKAGVVTITASFAGGEISSTNYCSSGQSYTLTVTCGSETAPVITTSGSSVTCSSTITLFARQAAPSTDFADGTYQWYRNGVAISGATAKTYTATTGGVYTVERTKDGCTTVSSNKATITNETLEPEVTRLVPFQYYHKDKTYTEQMKLRHLFAVKDSREYGSTERNFKMELSKNGDPATDVTSSNAFVVKQSDDHTIDTILIDLNKLATKYAENDELEFTCYAVECGGTASALIKSSITMHVIGSTPTLALICSGADGDGTRTTKKLVVGGDFLTGYNKADLCVQTGNTTFDASQEWGLYTKLKNHYIVTPVNGYAEFNKLNYEPFDVLLLTDYPKSSRSEAAQVVIDDMAALCDYRPLLSFKTHFQSEKWKKPNEDGDSVYVYTKWTKKGFTTPPVVTKSHGKLNLNIVCYAHPMFDAIKHGEHVYRDNSDQSQLVYTMLTDEGHEGKKGMQGFEIDAAENFVTIGLTHFNATIATNNPSTGLATWTPGDKDRMLVTVAERQANLEARMILFSLNCGAQSMLTAKGDTVVMKCLEYLISDAANPLTPKADCSFTFDNGAGAPHNADWYKDEENCPGCSGELGDGLWTTEANWGPDRINEPGEFTSVRIAASVEVDDTHAHVLDVRVVDGGSITIPAGKALEVKGTIRHLDGSEISPTGNDEISIGSSSTGNGTLIFNNNTGDTKARVAMYSNAQADIVNMSAATSIWQYIGTPHTDVVNARSNYYGSWIYQYGSSGWEVIPNGGPLEAFRGYCITHPDAPVVFDMHGTLAATTLQDISIPAGYTVIANSWVAPIDISTFTDDDMENISDKTIYFFNTGTDVDGNHGTGTEAGTYVSVPKNSASYVGTWQIPSMQGFYISTTSAGTLHLDYDRHVRPHSARTIVGNKMYAPRRAATESEEPNVLKIFARGSRYQDKLVVLEREDFTRGYDSGWDGEAWGGGTLSPMVYVTGEGREDAVSAIPEFEGTVIAFKAGEDNDYHFDFIYDGEESLYLFDTENNTYTQIMTGESYYFSTDDKAPHSRFILTRRGPQIATGIEPTSDSSLKGRAKKLLIDDKMYILLNGALYDATGKMVK